VARGAAGGYASSMKSRHVLVVALVGWVADASAKQRAWYGHHFTASLIGDSA